MTCGEDISQRMFPAATSIAQGYQKGNMNIRINIYFLKRS